MDNDKREEKLKAIEAAISQIEKDYGKGSVMCLGNYDGLDISTISTGCLSLDIALGVGGIPRGRIIEVYGPESSGKTTLALTHDSRSTEGEAEWQHLSMQSMH